MVEHTFDDQDMTGYFLPKGSQRLLAQVCSHVRFLARLGQPHGADQPQDAATEVSRSDWTFCLEQLAEQLDQVLKAVSRRIPARDTAEAPDEADDEDDEAGAASAQAEAHGFVYGVTLEQIDQLNLLIPAIIACGDAVSADDMADFAEGTLTMLGHAIFDKATEVAELLDEVQAQRLERGARIRFSVEETPPAYCIRMPSEADHAARAAPARAYPLEARSPRPGGLQLH